MMWLLLYCSALASSLDQDRVFSLTPPDEVGNRLYTTQWSVLMASQDYGVWSIDITALPWLAAGPVREACSIRLVVPGASFEVTCPDESVVPLVEDAVSRWETSLIAPFEEPGSLTLRLWFDRAGENPNIIRGYVAPTHIRQSGRGDTPSQGADEGVKVKRKRTPYLGASVYEQLAAPVRCDLWFSLNAAGRPVQLTLFETPSMMWEPILRAGWKWRFKIADGSAQASYRLQLTFVPPTQ